MLACCAVLCCVVLCRVVLRTHVMYSDTSSVCLQPNPGVVTCAPCRVVWCGVDADSASYRERDRTRAWVLGLVGAMRGVVAFHEGRDLTLGGSGL